MTIIAAVQDCDNPRRFYLAGNTMGTDGNLKVYDESKWHIVPGKLAVGLAGHFRGANVANEWADRLCDTAPLPSLYEIVLSLRHAFEEDGWSNANAKHADEPQVGYKQNVLLAGEFDGQPSVVSIGEDFGFVRYPVGKAAFDGSGYVFAHAAWRALLEAVGVRNALRCAVQTAIDLDTRCPGEVELLTFEV